MENAGHKFSRHRAGQQETNLELERAKHLLFKSSTRRSHPIGEGASHEGDGSTTTLGDGTARLTVGGCDDDGDPRRRRLMTVAAKATCRGADERRLVVKTMVAVVAGAVDASGPRRQIWGREQCNASLDRYDD